MEGSGRNPEGEVFSNASLFTAEPRAIYGAIITTDRLLYHPANILGRNPIAAQPLHTSLGPGNGQVKRSACREHFCQTLLGPGTPYSPSVYGQGGGCVLLPSQQGSALGAGENSAGLFCTEMPAGASHGNLLLLGQDGWVLLGTQTAASLLH